MLSSFLYDQFESSFIDFKMQNDSLLFDVVILLFNFTM